MRETLHIEESYQKLMPFVDEKHPFESVCEYFGFALGKDQRHRSKVVKGVLHAPSGEDIPVYFKLYGYNRLRRSLPRLIKASRSRGEAANIKFFHSLGIPACEVIAQGEYRNMFGLISNCLIITREVENSMQLDLFIDQLANSKVSEAAKLNIRRQIIESIAASLRKIHDKNFYHDDLKWRNILVRPAAGNGNKVEVFWIDCPNGYFDKSRGLRRRHGVIKDVATLDHLAWRNCTIEERQYFLSCYLGCGADSPELGEFADAVVEYCKRKLDD